jgi:hypothetical protein
MSRAGLGADRVIVKPTNNVYTVLLAVAVVVEILGLIALWMSSVALHGKNPFA